MAERDDLLESIATIMADYREGEWPIPTPQHVGRWVDQFEAAARLPLLREMQHVLLRTYFTRKEVGSFLSSLLKAKALVGENPCSFWKDVSFLDIQGGGASQHVMLDLLNERLEALCGIKVAQCGKKPKAYCYLDDVVFTGNRVRRDVEKWIEADAPASTELHVATIAIHGGGHYYADTKIAEAAHKAGKKIKVVWWRAADLEDRKSRTDNSDVLRPTQIPDVVAVKKYVAGMKYPPVLRAPGHLGPKKFFSSENGRHLVEQQFLIAGVRIREWCDKLPATQRPLGHCVLDTLGFGTLIVTYRNCPNNAPLAFWAGAPWYPLFPRTTNKQAAIKKLM